MHKVVLPFLKQHQTPDISHVIATWQVSGSSANNNPDNWATKQPNNNHNNERHVNNKNKF